MKRLTTTFVYSFAVLCGLLVFNSCDLDWRTDNEETVASTETPTEEVPHEPVVPATTTIEVTDSTAATGSENPTDEVVQPLEPTTPPSPVVSTSSTGDRIVSDAKMATAMETIARNLEADSLAYEPSLGQDCSGIYHKIKDRIQKRLPALADDTKYKYPSFAEVRSSRQIADWYHRNGNLHIVKDASADRNLIRPGCVMFYGRTDEVYDNPTIAVLTNADKYTHEGNKGKVMHIAVVTSVNKDDDGNLKNYTIMHGRNKDVNASRSGGNWESRSGSKTAKQHKLFPFGNWNQQWLAIANIETPVNE